MNLCCRRQDELQGSLNWWKVERRLHEIAFVAYEDQCSPANPRLPMVADMEEIMVDAYYGCAERPGRRK